MRYGLKDLIVDTDTRSVMKNGVSVDMPDLSFDVLVYLLQKAPQTVSAADFATGVWRTGYVSDETLAQRVALLRKSLGDTSKDTLYIRTVRGAGYAASGPVNTLKNKAEVSILFLQGRVGTRSAVTAVVAATIVVFMFVLFRQEDGVLPAQSPPPKTVASIMIDRARANLGLHQLTETSRAINMLREVLNEAPENFEARLLLSFALTTKATKFNGGISEKKEAEALARALIAEQPDNSNAWSALAYTLGAQGRSNESLPAYRRAYQLEPRNASAISSAAYEHLTRGNLYDALMLEMQARNVGGASRYAEIQIAQSLELIDHPATTTWQNRALSLNPNQVVIITELARTYMRRGEQVAALRLLDRIEGEDRFASPVLQLKGRIALTLKDIEQARYYLEAAGNRALLELTAFNALAGDLTLANELLSTEKLVEVERDTWAGGRVAFAEIAAAAGQQDGAVRFLAQAVNLGWRDIKWLQQSPYLRGMMERPDMHALIERISRELDAQKLLIQSDDMLLSFLTSEYTAAKQ